MSKKVKQVQKNQKKYYDHGSAVQEFNPGDLVWAQNYREGPKWVHGQVIHRTNPLSYKVQIHHGLIWKRHAQQLKPRIKKQVELSKNKTIDNDIAIVPAQAPQAPKDEVLVPADVNPKPVVPLRHSLSNI